MNSPEGTTHAVPARERILTAAYELFSHRGIRAVGTDQVIERAGVAKATLYRHFATKNDLVLAVLLAARGKLDEHGTPGAIGRAHELLARGWPLV